MHKHYLTGAAVMLLCLTVLAGCGETQESNCVCGKYHTGPFAGIIKFFHRIVYFFKNLFGKN